ncbi:MAG TPA: L-seryl-tRNA(Sec) selenium transferase [Candidatus Dormibacteraeota bacterium]|nr:L-seryl-tRNA(Sec) selenium transferase [Candidatus Dormibacteraeota bacterium]
MTPPPARVRTAPSATALRGLPAVGALLGDGALAPLVAGFGQARVLAVVRATVAAERDRRRAGTTPRPISELVEAIAGTLAVATPLALRRVINGTGVVLHTNLGRAPLSPAAVAAVADIAGGYSTVEFDLALGRRGYRQALLAALLCEATGAEAAMVVNNGAAAVLLALTALCQGLEVVVSRGEAIEIGGGFRIPEVLACSGAVLVDAGTTNRTRVDDYRRATTAATAAYLRVHPSNFAVSGFTARPGLADLAAAARAAGVFLLVDAGSGLLGPAAGLLGREEPLPEALRAGADLVMGSGDKLLGASQAGIIAGRAALVSQLRRHPLARALRPDKLQLAALQATLLAWQTPARRREIPLWRMLGLTPATLRPRVARWVRRLEAAGVAAGAADCASAVGGGTTPGPTIPSVALTLPTRRAAALRRRLLQGEPPVVALERPDAVWIDARTVLPGEERALLAAVVAASSGTSADGPAR